MVLWTDTPVSAVELCSSIRVTFGLCAASLIIALLAWSEFLSRFVVVSCSFHLKMMNLIVPRVIIKDLDLGRDDAV